MLSVRVSRGCKSYLCGWEGDSVSGAMKVAAEDRGQQIFPPQRDRGRRGKIPAGLDNSPKEGVLDSAGPLGRDGRKNEADIVVVSDDIVGAGIG